MMAKGVFPMESDAMMTFRLVPFLCLFYATLAFGQGVVLLPFDAPERSRADGLLFQASLRDALALDFRVFEGEGVAAALLTCSGEVASIQACLSRIGDVFEAGLGARGRWAATKDGGAFSLELIDLRTGRLLFSGENRERLLPEISRIAALVHRLGDTIFRDPKAVVTVVPGMRFVRLPGGEPVYLQAGEVTQAQWRMVMGYNPAWFIACGEDCPVESVTREEIDRFIRRMNTMGQGRFRLPTLGEWQRALPMADGAPACLDDNNCVAYGGYPCDQWPGRGAGACPRCGPRPYAGRGEAFGNMTGNVWEWLASPGGGLDGAGFLIGGGWADPPSTLFSRVRAVPSRRFAADDVGFRLLLEGEAPIAMDTH